MSTVRSMSRLLVVACAVAFACMMATVAMPAFADEGDVTGGLVAPGSGDVNQGTTQPDDDAANEGDDSTQTPGQDTSTDDDANKPADGDTPATGDDANTPADSDKPGTSTGTTGDDTQNDQDKTDQDTPTEPEKPAEPEVSYEDSHANMYRLYNPNSGEHFYTMSLHEATSVAEAGWQWEGIGWVAPLKGTPVYRLYNPNAGDHHYTTSDVERAHLISVGWNDEGIGWYSDGADHTAVLRQYNPNAVTGAHNFSTSWVENDNLVGAGWSHEGIAWYATNGPTIAIQGRWLITSAWGGLNRYWIASNGAIAKDRFIESDEGTGYTAYAKGDGSIVRGAHEIAGEYVVVADNEGRVASTPDGKDGWVIGDYGDGLQRYYYVASQRAMDGAFFTIDGVQYYGRVDTGYVVRGKFKWGDLVLLGDGDGRLATGAGWLVTDIYDGGTQRYWLVATWEGSEYAGAKTGLVEVDGKLYYGNPNHGYIDRNKYVYADRWYTADNDGWLSASVSPEEGDMLLRAQGFSSPTDYLLLVDTGTCRLGIFRGGQDNWTLESFNKCVCGAPWSPTITGTYSTGYHLPVLPDWSNALYCTNITGGYFFHSVLGSTDELGQHLSHGCIRVDWPLAQYIQSIPYGSTVHLY